MKRANKVFEAHLHTVQLAGDPCIMEFQKAMFSCLQEATQGNIAPLMEAPSELSHEDIKKLFKAAEQILAGGETESTPTQAPASKLKQTMRSMKQRLSGAIPNPKEKIDKMLKRTMAVLSTVEGGDQLKPRLQKAVKNAEMTEPKVVLATLGTVIANAGDPKYISPLMDMVATMDEDEHIENFGPAERPEDEPFVEPIDDPVMDDYDIGRAALRNVASLLSSNKAGKLKRALGGIIDEAETDHKLAAAIRPYLETMAYSKDVGEIKAAIKAARNVPAQQNESFNSLKQVLGWG